MEGRPEIRSGVEVGQALHQRIREGDRDGAAACQLTPRPVAVAELTVGEAQQPPHRRRLRRRRQGRLEVLGGAAPVLAKGGELAQSIVDQLNDKVAEDPLMQRGIIVGLKYLPLPKSKNKWLKGIDLRFNYVNLPESDSRTGDNGQMKITSRTRTNRVTFFSMSTNGRHTYVEPSIHYTVGPFEIGYAWSRNTGEQKRAGKTVDETDARFDGPTVADVRPGAAAFAGSDFSEARMTSNIIGMGMFLWGPKGFMSGSRNGGWKLSYVHNRMYLDAGSGFNERDETHNEFRDMRKWHVIENVIMLRWYHKRNLTWALQYELNGISKMEGGGKAPETRRRAGISATGGTYQVISLHSKWVF